MKNGLKDVLSNAINEWFYLNQEELGIKTGDEPLDSMVEEYTEQLVDECNRVLEFQKKYNRSDNEDMVEEETIVTDVDGDGDVDKVETTKINPNILGSIKDFGN